jgi:hypothetical protein
MKVFQFSSHAWERLGSVSSAELNYDPFIGNSLRALVKYLDNIPEDVISNLNIPTGVPLVYDLDADLKPIPHADAIAPLSVSVRPCVLAQFNGELMSAPVFFIPCALCNVVLVSQPVVSVRDA